MIVRMGLLQQRADIDHQEFRARWRNGHGPLASKLPGLRCYHQNHVTDRQQRGITYARGALNIDGFSELWFDDLPSMQAAFASEKQIKELGEDEDRFIGEMKLITAVQHVVIAKPTGVPLIKRMSTLKRRPDVSTEKFQQEWFDVHSVLVKRLFALTLLVAQSTLVLSSFVRIGGPREIQSTKENWRTTVTSQSIRSESRRTEQLESRARLKTKLFASIASKCIAQNA